MKSFGALEKATLLRVFLFFLVATLQNVLVSAQELEWFKLLGSQGAENGKRVSTDLEGNVITFGTFEFTASYFPANGAPSITAVGAPDGFISKYSPTGDLLWIRSFGSSEYDDCTALAIDFECNIYAGGNFQNEMTFEDGFGFSETITASSYRNAFIIKLSPTGAYQWVKVISDTDYGYLSELAIDRNGDLLAVGSFGSADFDLGPDTLQYNSIAELDGFLLKMDSNAEFKWVKRIGGANGVGLVNVAADFNNDIITTGSFYGDASLGTNFVWHGGEVNSFITKFDEDGNILWIDHIYGDSRNGISSMCLDGDNGILITGTFKDTIDCDPDSTGENLLITGEFDTDVYVARFNSNGDLDWAHDFGASNIVESIGRIARDINGDVYFPIGFKGFMDADPSPTSQYMVYATTPSGYYDSFMLRLTNNGEFVSVFQLDANGTTDGMHISDIHLSPTGSLFFTGTLAGSIDMDPNGLGTVVTASNAIGDYIVAKYDQLDTGIPTVSAQKRMLIYPNPTKGVLNIRTTYQGKTDYRIFNSVGQMVLSGSFSTTESQIDLSLPIGYYSIELSDETSITIESFVIH